MQGMLDSTWPAQLIGPEERDQVETMVNTVEEGHQAIEDTIVGKRTKARGLGHP